MQRRYEPWPTTLPSFMTIELAERVWPRDESFRPDKLRLARQARGYSMTELAKRSSLSVRRVSALERNRATPTDADKEQLSVALAFPVSFFAQSDPVIAFGKCISKGYH